MQVNERYEIILNFLVKRGGIGEDKINKDKLLRQVTIIDKWVESKGRGALLACTGFGKTWVGLFVIYFMNRLFPECKTNIIVPTKKLYDQWLNYIDTFYLVNCNVYVVNTYTMSDKMHECDLLIPDETHYYLSDNARFFNKVISKTKYRFCLPLSATLDKKEKEILTKLKCPVIEEITLDEGIKRGYVSPFYLINFGITLSEREYGEYEKINEIHNSNYAKFNYFEDPEHNYQLAMACTKGNNKKASVGGEFMFAYQWRRWYALEMGWDDEDDEHEWSPRSISQYAGLWIQATKKRKDYIFNHQSKIDASRKIIDLFNRSTIVFSESIDFSDKLDGLLGEKSRVYHSKIQSKTVKQNEIKYRKTLKGAKVFASKVDGVIGTLTEDGYPITYSKDVKIGVKKQKEENVALFELGKIDVLCTVKALNAGFDVEGIELGVITSGLSKWRDFIQRVGRAIRFVPGKTAIFIDMYIKNTKDEFLLKRRQSELKTVKPIWIDNFEKLETWIKTV